jgi:hypothetical protein
MVIMSTTDALETGLERAEIRTNTTEIREVKAGGAAVREVEAEAAVPKPRPRNGAKTPAAAASAAASNAAIANPAKGREFIAEVDCIYNGRYVTAGTIVFAEADRIPHFRRA